jgi:hypothetical protein
LNILKHTRLYTIGPMEYEDGREWRQIVRDALEPRGITIFDPYEKPFINGVPEDIKARKQMMRNIRAGRFEIVYDRMSKVRGEDLRICDVSDFFIVKVVPSMASWGSAEELFTANRMKKPIFVWIVGGVKKCPLWIRGTLPPKYIHGSLSKVLSLIKKIDDGVIKIDSDRWRLLKPELR